MSNLTRDNLESVLDSGNLEVAIRNPSNPSVPRWWRARRNGKTRTWKREPSRFEIPFKAGLWVTGRVSTADVLADGRINPAFFRIAPDADREF